MQINDPVKVVDPFSYPHRGFVQNINGDEITVYGVSLVSGEHTGTCTVDKKFVEEDKSLELIKAIKLNRDSNANYQTEISACEQRYKDKISELAKKHGVTPEVVEAIMQEMNKFYWPG